MPVGNGNAPSLTEVERVGVCWARLLASSRAVPADRVTTTTSSLHIGRVTTPTTVSGDGKLVLFPLGL